MEFTSSFAGSITRFMHCLTSVLMVRTVFACFWASASRICTPGVRMHACMYTCVYVCVCIRMHAWMWCMYVCTQFGLSNLLLHRYTQLNTIRYNTIHTYIHTYIRTYIHENTHSRSSVSQSTQMTHIYIHTYIHTYTSLFVHSATAYIPYIYTHTYIHTYT